MLKIMTERQLDREVERRLTLENWNRRVDERMWKLEEVVEKLRWRIECLEGTKNVANTPVEGNCTTAQEKDK